MRALVLSDIHGNIDALQALADQWQGRFHEFDHVIVLGDLVDYGPRPHDVIGWVQTYATDVVRGNHDHAMATGESCRSSPLYLEAAIATRDRLRPTLTSSDLDYLSRLDLTRPLAHGDERWRLLHATPRDPLFDYVLPTDDEARWTEAFGAEAGQFVMVGHTHLAFVRGTGGGLVINPGSLGMPKDGHPGGSYAIVDGDAVQFRRVAYDPTVVVDRLRELELPARVFSQLAATFLTGS
jgi:predicted phosphodiesterase